MTALPGHGQQTGDIPTNRDNGPDEDPLPAYWFSG